LKRKLTRSSLENVHNANKQFIAVLSARKGRCVS
jgi:hypothetical protein